MKVAGIGTGTDIEVGIGIAAAVGASTVLVAEKWPCLLLRVRVKMGVKV